MTGTIREQHHQPIETPESMRMRRRVRHTLRGHLGTPVPEEQLQHAWDNMDFGERNKLRFSQFFNIMAKPITKDLTNIYINLMFLTIAMIPGPSGMFVIPALAASYLVRWDERAKEVRRKVGDLIKNDVHLERYNGFVKQHHDKTYKVDWFALKQRKVDALKHSTQQVKEAAQKHIPTLYNNTFKAPFKKVGSLLQSGLGKITSPERAEKSLAPLFNQCAKAEQAAIATVVKTGQKIDSAIKHVGGGLSDAFNGIIEIKERLGEELYYGWQYNKQQVRNTLRRNAP